LDGVGIASASLASACLAALWLVSLVGWVRTRRLRRGHLPAARDRPVPAATSPATLLPGATGLFLAVAGVTRLADEWGLWPMILAVAGLGVAIPGFVARVERLEVRPDALVIRYRARPAFAVPWDTCRSVIPPRWPLGGWRVAGERSRILMPSDLLGQEQVLDAVIARAGLRYRSGAWTRTDGTDMGAAGSPT
jgi:hypothetical protein